MPCFVKFLRRYESNGGYVVFTETLNVKPDPQNATLCANCGSPNDLKQW